MKKLPILILMAIGFPLLAQNSIQLELKNDYLNLPVSYDEEDRVSLELVIGKEVVRYIDIYLPDAYPDFWVFLDVSDWKGKGAILRTGEGENKKGLGMVYQSDERKYLENLYNETHRPQLHFSTIRGWINDPNGLVYYDGEYHLFFQHYPFGYYWGQPHWGHAVSTDLVHWEQLSDALYKHEHAGIFSGSSVIDYKNTSGFKSGENDVMVAIYATTMFLDGRYASTQNIAYSNDRGRTFTDYKYNPAIGDRFEELGTDNARDPKVFWHEPTGNWVMVVYERIGHSIFTSPDLKNWKYQSHTETFWECPELFELPVDGNPDSKKWIMYGVSGDYLIGDFDGKKFTPEQGMFNYLQGKFFAAQTFTNIPADDGRRIQMGYCEIPGWVDIPEPNPPFNGLMGFPTELTLRTTANGVRMFNEPVKEIELLHTKTHQWENLTMEEANEALSKIQADLLHVKCEIENENAIAFSLIFDEDVLYYTLKPNVFYYNEDVDESESFTFKYLPELGSNTMYFECIVDRTSLEVFVDHGRFTMVLPRKLNPHKRGMSFHAGDGGQPINDIRITKLEVYEMRSIWEEFLEETRETDEVLIKRAVELASKVDQVILVMGTNRFISNEESDAENLLWPGKQGELIRRIFQANPKVILVLVNGFQITMNWEKENIPAIVETWYAGQEQGIAIAEVLFGDYNPGGKLPVTYYQSEKDLPPIDDYDITKGRTYWFFDKEVLFPFGHGLSYTSFEYGKLETEQDSPGASSPAVNVSVEIRNTGSLKGDEVVQLYLRDVQSEETQAVKKLRAFKRVSLEAGESSTLEFILDEKDFMYWSEKQQGWYLEPGEFEIQVGSSSEDIRLKKIINSGP